MPAVIRITAESSIATGAVNVWHWIIPNSSPSTESSGCVSALDTFYTAIQGVLAAGTWTIGQRVVTVDQSPNLILGATQQSAAGTGVGNSQLSSCYVLQLGSQVVGGSHRGRIYLGPLDTTSISADGRTPNPSDVSTVVTAAAALMAFTTNGVQLAVWSRKNNVAQAVTSVGVRNVIGVQRRRLT